MFSEMIQTDIFIPVFVVACFFTWLIATTVTRAASKAFVVWRVTRLKELMLERGLNAVEIERVVSAGQKNAPMNNTACSKEKFVSG